MFDIKDYRPLQLLAASLFFKHKRLLLCLPRQFGGKTELGVRLTENLLKAPNAKQCIFLAKDKKSAKRAVREKHIRIFDKNLFKINTELVQYKSNPSAVCYIESVDKEPDRIRGGTFGLVHWSEVAFSKIEHGHTIKDVFDKVVQPTLRLSSGYCLLESTNNGRNGWYDMWEDYKTYDFQRLMVSFGQMVEMGLVDRETYDYIKKTTHPDVFRQEYECEWVTFQGKVYSELDMNKHVTADMAFPDENRTVVFAIDWGFTDATCILFAYVKNKIIHIFDEIYEREKTLDEIFTLFDQRRAMWKYRSIAGAADHDPQKIKELNRRGIPCKNAQKADTLGNRLQVKEKLYKDEILIHPRCKMLLKDLTTCVWDKDKLNDIDYDQCTWGHYDGEATLRYLIRELSDFEDAEPIKNPFAGEDDVSAAAWEMAQQRKARFT